MSKSLFVIILAAGKGTRMRSSRPKVLHEVAGKPMLGHVLDQAYALNPRAVFVIVGHGAEQVKASFSEGLDRLEWVIQQEQLGTGDAVQSCLPALNAAGAKDDDKVLILSGDVPLIRHETLEPLISASSPFNMVTLQLAQPTGYGRIVRDSSGQIVGVVEEKDARPEQRAIQEINTNIFALDYALLAELLPKITNNNAQREYYLPDLVELAANNNVKIQAWQPEFAWEVEGVNNRVQLEALGRKLQHYRSQLYLEQGLNIADRSRFDVFGELEFGQDCSVGFNVAFSGKVVLGERVRIDHNVCLHNVVIGDDCHIRNFSDLEGAKLAERCTVGPYARLRPGSVLAKDVRLGNFVETKKVSIGEGSKLNHLSYAGDCDIGQNVNIGAGTIVCNYDGVNKHQTQIQDDVFVGSNTCLVAPVVVQKGATIAAGSVVTKPAPAGQLTIARARQTSIPSWQRPTKQTD